jgi:hypothetical protein
MIAATREITGNTDTFMAVSFRPEERCNRLDRRVSVKPQRTDGMLPVDPFALICSRTARSVPARPSCARARVRPTQSRVHLRSTADRRWQRSSCP